MVISQPNQVGSLQKVQENILRLSQDDPTKDPILHNSSQEASLSSIYDCVLDELLFMVGS